MRNISILDIRKHIPVSLNRIIRPYLSEICSPAHTE